MMNNGVRIIHTSYFLLLASYSLLPTSYSLLPASYFIIQEGKNNNYETIQQFNNSTI